ncbi:MAG TPA: ATP-binding protein [Marmoricola sp.]|nr:ATP-binding protein [Marmoricola sp.]
MTAARVVVVAGPSGAGKSRLTRRLGLPALNLDDFYKNGDDPTLPCLELTGGDPITDWDDPASWNAADAVATITALCRTGAAQVPTYDIATSRRTGTTTLQLDGAHFLVAEGIFAQEVVAVCRRLGLLADAVCVTQHPLVTFVRRLSRDLREHRKPPFYLLRRGLHLALAQRKVVARAVEQGCRVVSGDQAYAELTRLWRA